MNNYHIFIPTVDSGMLSVIHWSFKSFDELISRVKFCLTPEEIRKYNIFHNVWQVRVMNMVTKKAVDIDIESLLNMFEDEIFYD